MTEKLTAKVELWHLLLGMGVAIFTPITVGAYHAGRISTQLETISRHTAVLEATSERINKLDTRVAIIENNPVIKEYRK